MDSLEVKIELGDLFFWSKIQPGNMPPAFLTLQKSIKNAPYAEGNPWLQHILLQAENNGYPLAEVKLDSMKSNENSLSAVANFEFGLWIKWDSRLLMGLSKTNVNYIQNLTGINPGEA
jgi:hypothetical protein